VRCLSDGADDAGDGKNSRSVDTDETNVSGFIPYLAAHDDAKVMPVMLERVAEQIPMPDYMLAQMPH